MFVFPLSEHEVARGSTSLERRASFLVCCLLCSLESHSRHAPVTLPISLTEVGERWKGQVSVSLETDQEMGGWGQAAGLGWDCRVLSLVLS